MIGLMHQVLFAFVASRLGKDAVDSVRADAGVPRDRDFRMDRTYPDDEWRNLVGAAVRRSAMAPEVFEFALGRFAAEMLHERFGGFFSGKPTLHEMLRRQVTVHAQLARTMPDEATRRAVGDKFQLVADGDELVVRYRSPNDHLVLYRGMADRLTEMFDEPLAMVVEDFRVAEGADYLIRLRFPMEARRNREAAE